MFAAIVEYSGRMFAAIAEYSGRTFAAIAGGGWVCRRDRTMGLGSYKSTTYDPSSKRNGSVTHSPNSTTTVNSPASPNQCRAPSDGATERATHESEDPETLKFYSVLFRNIPGL
ncbi:unnamed protein product [Calypogeia fissa]